MNRRRRGPLLAASSPAGFLGSLLLAWWDFTDPATVFTDTAGTTLASPGSAIARVNDKVGNYPLIQGTGTLQPLYQTDRSALFDGTDDYLSFDGVVSLPVAAVPSEIHAAVRQDAAGATGAIMYAMAYGGGSSNDLRGIGRQQSGGANRGVVRVGSGAANTGVLAPATILAEGRRVIGGAFGATSSTAFVETVSNSGAVVPATGATRIRMGATNANALSQWWTGKIITAVVTSPLTTAQRAQLYVYLAQKRDQMT
jgi:hypothetical protein